MVELTHGVRVYYRVRNGQEAFVEIALRVDRLAKIEIGTTEFPTPEQIRNVVEMVKASYSIEDTQIQDIEPF